MTVLAPSRPLRSHHVCGACGALASKWQGRCPSCGEWNALSEESTPVVAAPAPAPSAAAVPVALESVPTLAADRRVTGLLECDRVLGGGVVPGSLVLLGGDPGIGKSTLALDLAARCGSQGSPALYCAGEESVAQVSLRAERTGCRGPHVEVLADTDLDTVLAAVEGRRPPLAVVDSVQTLRDGTVGGAPGSVNQLRSAAGRLLACANATGVPILLVGHVTKDGAIAGPRTLEHMVDVVLYLEGEGGGEHRLLRSVKNRFGTTEELGIFVLRDTGLEEATTPARAFIEAGSLEVPGNVLTVTCEGSRPLAVEVQALVAPTAFSVPRRTVSGFDLGRLHLLLAIIERRGGIALGKADVFVNAVGGIRVAEPAADLAVALAVAGAATDRPLARGALVVGELGLAGEVRGVRRLGSRLAEAAALGLESAVVPAADSASGSGGLRLNPVSSLAQALSLPS